MSKHHDDDGVVVLSVARDLDESTEDAFLCIIENCVDAALVAELVVDLAHVTFLGSCGIGALLVGRETVMARGATFRVDNPHGIVLEVLVVTQVARLLNITSNAGMRDPVRPGGDPRAVSS